MHDLGIPKQPSFTSSRFAAYCVVALLSLVIMVGGYGWQKDIKRVSALEGQVTLAKIEIDLLRIELSLRPPLSYFQPMPLCPAKLFVNGKCRWKKHKSVAQRKGGK